MDKKSNIDYQFDFRQVFSSLLDQWFEVDAIQMNSAFFREFDTLPIIGGAAYTNITATAENTLKVYPNPLTEVVNVECETHASTLTIDVMDMQGRIVDKIYRGSGTERKTSLQWNTSNLPIGKYLVIQRNGGKEQVFPVIKH
jgi:hypothetical protein